MSERGVGLVGVARRERSGPSCCVDLALSASPLENSSCGRYALLLDGEVHNEDELRSAAAAAGMASRGDSAVLEALIALGAEALAKCNGAWSLAFVDRHQKQLLLARDHLGIRPLYLYQDGPLWFASEIKAIVRGSGDRFECEPSVVARYLQQTLLDAQPETFFAGITALPAGSAARVDLAGEVPSSPVVEAFWSLPDGDSFEGDLERRVAAIRERCEDAVRLRTGGDPLGVMLSGGVDSSSISAMALQSVGAGRDLQLVSGVSADARFYDPLLDVMCAHLGREPNKIPLEIRAEDALDRLAEVVRQNDEPVRSFITVTEYRLKEASRELGVPVLLSGLGADEVFSGNLLHKVFLVQSLLRAGKWWKASRVIAAVLRRKTIRPRFRQRVQKRYFPSLDREKHDVRGSALPSDGARLDVSLGQGSCQDRLLEDITRFSLPSLLHFDHRTSTAFGLQTRMPYLDHRLVELVAPAAPEVKLRSGYTKWLLRESMQPHLPREVAWRVVKQGGTDAHGEWLKHDMRGPISGLLAGDLASADLGLLDADALRARYRAFCAQPPDKGSISSQDVFNPIAIELWARAFASHLRS